MSEENTSNEIVEDPGEPIQPFTAAETPEAIIAATDQEASPATPDRTTEKFDQKPNATLNYATSGSRTKGTPDTIAIPSATVDMTRRSLDATPNIDVVVGEQQQKWAGVVQEAMYHQPMEDMYVERLNKEGADFRQSVSHNGVEMRGRAPAFDQSPGEKTIEGERALIQLVAHLGIGGLFRAPMWNSGFWVTFKPATESELLELNRIMVQDKIQAGRWSYGLALSNTVVYTLDRVIDFILGHVYNTSVKPDEFSIADIKKHLAPQDINAFIWGFLCANYPTGFHYSSPCIKNPSSCQHVIEENLNVSKLNFTDNSALTEWQKNHMTSSAANSKSLESVKRYREEMKALHHRRVVLNEGTKHELAFTIKTPTVIEYIDQGHRWIGGIVEGVNAVLGIEDSGNMNARNAQINKITKATTLCQYIHWIDSIEYGVLTPKEGSDETKILKIVDRATIEETLKQLSATDSIRESIISEVLKYISDSTITVIGVPAFDCPVCDTPQESDKPEYPRHASIIPLDVIQVFFALLGQRLNRIEERTSR